MQPNNRELGLGARAGGRLSINGEITRPADAYAGLFRASVNHRQYVKVVTFWSINDAVSWLARGRPLLFDGNDQAKPAFDAVLSMGDAKQLDSTKSVP